MLKKALVYLLVLFGMTNCGPSGNEIQVSAIDHFKRGNNYYKQQKLQSAAEEYKLAIALDPKQDRFHYNLGLVYQSLILYEKAISEYNRAIEINPKFGEAWYNLSLALEKTNETEKAYLAYQKYQMINQEEKESRQNKPKPVVLSKPGGSSEKQK